MKVAVIGLGKMGNAIALKLHQNNIAVVGYDCNSYTVESAAKNGITVVDNIEKLRDVDLFWLMVPAGDVVDRVIADLIPICTDTSIIIDGGNSFYKDSQRRYAMVSRYGIAYLDCGTSGGIHGMKNGFCFMVGGDNHIYNQIVPLLQMLSVPGGYQYVGRSGAGHYVKMVHNGIEYGIMQAYAEGLHILKEGAFKHDHLDLAAITGLWNTNSVIRSFLLSLAHEGLEEDQELEKISGKVAESGMGLWTHQEACENNIPDGVLTKSLEVRAQSRHTGGNYATKIVSLLRNKFGGHDCTY